MNPGRAIRRRQARERCRLNENHGVMAGWCATADDLPEARQRSHDSLIELMGERRRGGVSWQQLHGTQALEALDILHEGASPALSDHYRRLRGLLREHGGWLVIASAPGDPSS